MVGLNFNPPPPQVTRITHNVMHTHTQCQPSCPVDISRWILEWLFETKLHSIHQLSW